MKDFGLNLAVMKEKAGCQHAVKVVVQKDTGCLSFRHGKAQWDMQPGEDTDYFPMNIIEWLVSLHE